MRLRGVLLILLTLSFAAASEAGPKDKKLPPAKTGIYSLPWAPTYIYLSVPKDYDAAKFYPLLFVLHPDDAQHPGDIKPDDYVTAWGESVVGKTWIVAGLYMPVIDNELTIQP